MKLPELTDEAVIKIHHEYGGGLVLPILTIIMFALKVSGVIDWSWWIVFLPMWGPVVLILIVLLFIILLIWLGGVDVDEE